MARPANMKRWQCPKCNSEIEAIASVVSHRCPNNKSQHTEWKEVDK